MTALSRQNTLFVAENWIRIYEALENVDFRAYDFENLVQALMNYLRANYPEEFNDWIASSEFVTKIEVLAWLSQNIAFRVDLNSRENFLATAERRDSLIRLAQNVAYKVNRVRSAQGLVKITSVSTSEPLRDSNNTNLQDRIVRWNDPRDEDWFERFILIMNAAFTTRTQFGKPLVQSSNEGIQLAQYLFNSIAPTNGAYSTTASVSGVNLPFDLYNGLLDGDTGIIREISPTGNSTYGTFYRLDGRGFGSPGSGFFFPIKQGNLTYQDEEFTNPVVLRTVDLDTQNINRDDFFVQRIDDSGNVLETWTQVDTIFGESVSFNTLRADVQNVYEIDTLTNDRVRVRFGDASFGRIPVGRFRFWYRTANPQPLVVKTNAIQNESLVIPYARNNQIYYLTVTYSLTQDITNAAATESNFDIRSRANKVFYTQNRMITAEDYQNFYLKDVGIRKVKTVNRTFSGHSRFSRLNDPTGLYQNVKHMASDGRFYEDYTRSINTFSADTSVLSLDEIINEKIKPLLAKPDKELLYYTRYFEVFFDDPLVWNQTSVVSGQARGNVQLGSVAQPVGGAGSGSLSYIKSGALLRYTRSNGPFTRVDRVVEDGDAADGVILKDDDIPNGASIVSVFPAFRKRLTNQEQIDLKSRLEQRLDFALSWDLTTESWQIINFDDIDKTGEFNLENQGDKTGGNKDASWMVLAEFIPGGDFEDQWKITERGLSLIFESAREIDFIFANTEPVVDTQSGRVFRDNIEILSSNESRDSLRRRGLGSFGDTTCEIRSLTFFGDGTETCFKTNETPLNEETSVILVNTNLQILDVDYQIERNVSGDSICFFDPPPDGSLIELRLTNEVRNATLRLIPFTGDGSTDEYDLLTEVATASNLLTALDGVLQYANTDYGTGILGTNVSIIYNTAIPQDVQGVVYSLGGIDSNAFSRSSLSGNGSDATFTFPAPGASNDSTLVSIDGVVQARDTYTVVGDSLSSQITFTTPPAVGTKIRVIAPTRPQNVKSRQYSWETDGVQNSFSLTGLRNIRPEMVLVFLDGVLQIGPWDPANQVWQVTGGNTVFFLNPPDPDLSLNIYVLVGAIGTNSQDRISDLVPVESGISGGDSNNLGRIDVSSCLVNYLGEGVNLTPVDVIRHPDGYVNKNGLSVVPADDNINGFFDYPLLFRNLVILDGFTDLVLWRSVREFGFDVWQPISPLTSPKGTYGISSQGGPGEGDSFDPTEVADGDIHYDIFTKTWLVANGDTDTWEVAEDQSDYQYRIGRDNLRFQWTHYAPEANRIDPSPTNIMNVYILTTGYDTAYRTWLDQNGDASEEPQPETSEQLRIQYQEFQDFKAQSDSIIHYAVRYKPLFGNQAVPELRATFKIVQTPGSRVSDSDLRLRVLNTINSYFDVNRWDVGESFYFTELCAFIHARLAPDLQSVVIVPRDNDQAFGRLFQVRSEPDELLISAASPEDIEIVSSLTDDELRVGSFS